MLASLPQLNTPRRHSRRLGLAVAAALVAGAVVWLVLPREPAYGGRTLTRWLAQYAHSSLEETQALAEARQAVRAMPPDRVWPTLLDKAKDSDGVFRAKLIEAGERWNVPVLNRLESEHPHLRAEHTHVLAIAGFKILGDTAAPAVPELARRLDEPALAYVTVPCLAHIGTPAQAALVGALTNSHPQVRLQAAVGLVHVFDDVGDLLVHLAAALRDPASEVRSAAVWSIARQTHAPEAALPLLITALADRESTVAGKAAKSLLAFGTNAVVALPALRRMAEDASHARARSALRVLFALAPGETPPALLRHLEDKSIGHRRMAAGLFYDCTNATPQMVAALERAARDPDEVLSNIATRVLFKLTGTNGAGVKFRPRGSLNSWPGRR